MQVSLAGVSPGHRMIPNTQHMLSKCWLSGWNRVSNISWLAVCCSQLTGFLDLIPLLRKAPLTLALVIFLKYNLILSYPSFKEKKCFDGLQIIVRPGMHSRWYMIRLNLPFQSGFLLSGAGPLPHSQVEPNFVPAAHSDWNAFFLASTEATRGFTF